MLCNDPNLYPAALEWHHERPRYGYFIANQWQVSAEPPLKVLAPATAKDLAWIDRSGVSAVDKAVFAARQALRGEWGQLSAHERGQLMGRFAQLVTEHVERLAWVEAYDTGKPISQARNDILAVARYFDYYGGAADKIHGETIPYQNGYHVSVVREPLGVTAHITPWNYPAQMFGRTLAPALAMGNATVLKPAEDACLVCLELAALMPAAGFPPGAINVVTGLGPETGAALSAHPDINFISFTGSPEVGKLIQQAAALHHIPVALELGGKSPQLIFSDADLDAAAASVCQAITQNAGQTCSAGSRVLIEKSILEPFLTRLTQQFEQLRIGAPEEDLDLGPVINAKQREKILAFIEQAKQAQVPVLAQALAPHTQADGFFVSPTVFGPAQPNSPLVQKEIFGPILTVQIFETEEEAIELANGTQFGLVAGVWTRDGARQQRLAQQIVSGQVFINCYGAGGGIELPFGGTKRSGYGREKGLQALLAVSASKTIVNFYH